MWMSLEPAWSTYNSPVYSRVFFLFFSFSFFFSVFGLYDGWQQVVNLWVESGHKYGLEFLLNEHFRMKKE